MTPEELQERFANELGDHVVGSEVAWGRLTLTLDAEGYVEAARLGNEDPQLNLDFFDCLSGVDEREDGFAVVAVLYSTEHRHRVLLRHLCAGGREEPTAPTLTDIYLGADWHEREAWDMFGIEFDGHPGVAPRILTTENFEGWPLRKDFHLATREAKPWPGLKEPLEIDEETGEPLEKKPVGPGASPGPTAPDEAMAEQAKRAAGVLDEEQIEVGEGTELDPEAPETTASDEGVGAEPDEAEAARVARAREKAAEMRRKRAEERAAGEDEGSGDSDEPRPVQEPTHEDVPAQTGPPGAPSGPEDEPFEEVDAGEATAEGGLRETIDEEADAAAEVEGGRRPGSVDGEPPEDEVDRGREGAEEALEDDREDDDGDGSDGGGG